MSTEENVLEVLEGLIEKDDMDNFKINSLVIDVEEKHAPRKVVMSYCERLGKKIKGLLGTTDNAIIFLTDYNKKLYKPYNNG